MSDRIEGNHASKILDCDEYQHLLQTRNLFLQAPLGILLTTATGRILAANNAFAEMLGYRDAEELSMLSKGDMTRLSEEPRYLEKLVESMNNYTRPLHIESRWKKKDGAILTCGLHVGTSAIDDGSICFFSCPAEDTSRQAAMEKALRVGREKYHSIFENTGAGTIIIENDTRISLANQGFANLTGYSKEEIEGKMRWPIFVAGNDDLERMLRYHNRRRQAVAQVPIEYEFTLRDKMGNLKDVFLRVDMIPGTDCSVASLLDTTSLKRAKRNLRESESRLSGIVEAFEGFIYICSGDYRLLYMNRKLEESVAAENDSTLPCHHLLYGFEAPCPWCSKDGVFEGRTIKYEFQNPRNLRWYYAVSSPVYADDDTITQNQTVIIDIHERKITEMALRERETYLHKENLRLRHTIRDRYRFGALIGKSSAMQKVYELILRAAATDANVILYGESGTGKELVAKAIHTMSDRREHTFLAVNCGAIPDSLMESEFFGYRKGAFTGALHHKPGYFAKAEQGTLFLDELGEINEAMQIKLLRVLEGNGYTPIGDLKVHIPDVRIISATNRQARSMLEAGTMREDFFYRIHIIPIHLPPLRDRSEDIPLLAEHFFKKYCQDTFPQFFSGHQMELLLQYKWPGNVRELENTIQRYLNLHVLEFSGAIDNSQPHLPRPLPPLHKGPELRPAARDFERVHILQLLEYHRWNRTKTARALGIERKTLYLKMKQLQIAPDTGK